MAEQKIDDVEIVVENQNSPFLIRPENAEKIMSAILHYFGLSHCSVHVSFVSEDEILSLNSEYREKKRSTDVLSFPQLEWRSPLTRDWSDSCESPYDRCEDGQIMEGVPVCLGDIIISPENAKRNAVDIGQSLDQELCFLMVHGILHLFGHDHIEPSDEEAMLKEQRQMMSYLESRESEPAWKGLLSEAESV